MAGWSNGYRLLTTHAWITGGGAISRHITLRPDYRIDGKDSIRSRLVVIECPICDISYGLIKGREQTVSIRVKVFRQRVARKW